MHSTAMAAAAAQLGAARLSPPTIQFPPEGSRLPGDVHRMSASVPAALLGGLSFADRLRRLGAEFEAETRQIAEAAVQSSQRETRLLRDEVDWLTRQLEDERNQSTLRLRLCTELKRQVEELHEQNQRQFTEKDYWQKECQSFEEKHGILEAKLASIALLEAEQAAAEQKDRQQERGSESSTREARPSRTLSMGGYGAQDDHRLPDMFHTDLRPNLSAAATVTLEAEGDLKSSSPAVPVPVPGPPVDAASASSEKAVLGGCEDAPTKQSDLCRCVELREQARLTSLLEALRGGGSEALGRAREAHEYANHLSLPDFAAQLSSHLVVELSVAGNTEYRRGEYEAAITHYSEAIQLCEASRSSSASLPVVDAGDNVLRAKDNLIRLRYNLARALHRLDRWTEARVQTTAVLELDLQYHNARALRAQASMSAFLWKEALADWDELLGHYALHGPVEGSGVDDETVNTWRKRREECDRHLSPSPYDVLELPAFSDIEKVKQAYKELARKWHPDKHQHKARDQQERAERKFSAIQQAYDAVGDEKTKRTYDKVHLARHNAAGLFPHGLHEC
eukprot:TRINITY_DN51396_c0_g2_i1.p1 TRINITY_DN51396_c0_g2~~TRINITY_DN51396_c0_g2_i1.p1  ORF type:complete len:566 (-),score=128.44 TRINITY_DN51396_c0_g2_i1:143-1840(-)